MDADALLTSEPLPRNLALPVIRASAAQLGEAPDTPQADALLRQLDRATGAPLLAQMPRHRIAPPGLARRNEAARNAAKAQASLIAAIDKEIAALRARNLTTAPTPGDSETLAGLSLSRNRAESQARRDLAAFDARVIVFTLLPVPLALTIAWLLWTQRRRNRKNR